MKEENAKIVTLFFVAIGFLTSFVLQVLFELLATYSGVVAVVYGQEAMRHALPIVVGFSVFFFLQLRKNSRIWAHEVIVEVRKVVWPSQQATFRMTVLVCIILIFAGFILGLFDLASSSIVNFIID